MSLQGRGRDEDRDREGDGREDVRRAVRFSLRLKVLLVFVPLILAFAALLALAVHEAHQIRRSLARVFEEERETEHTSALLVELLGAESWSTRSMRTADQDEIEDDLVGHLVRAEALVAELTGDTDASDPSDPLHEQRESVLRYTLSGSLATAVDAVHSGEWELVRHTIEDVRHRVEVLDAETHREAERAAFDLDRAVERLFDMLFLVSIVGLSTLAVLSWEFRRLILRPLDQLRRAALRFGAGRPHTPVPITARDEFGQLARTFDEMAARLESNREDLEQRVEERTREVFRAARLADLGKLAAGIAHEISNPLASIAAGTEGLRRDLAEDPGTTPESLERADLVIAEAYRARDIAARLLRLGRREERRVEPIWLEAIAREAAAMIAWAGRRREVEIVLDFPADLPHVESDANEWRQVLLNLLRNALDVAPVGSAIEVVGEVTPGGLALRVRDRGPGFPKGDLERVFEPFFTTKRSGEGTGLGLAIVERLVRESGGTVRAVHRAQGGEVVIELNLSSSA